MNKCPLLKTVAFHKLNVCGLIVLLMFKKREIEQNGPKFRRFRNSIKPKKI